jgi:hypothetical protein
MAFKVEDLMTKIIPGASPGPRIWACPDDSHGEGCQDDSRGQCPDDSRGNCQDDSRGDCQDDSRGDDCQDNSRCRDNTRGCPDDSNIPPPNCQDDSRPSYQTAGRGSEALALLQQQLRRRLDSIAEAGI